MSSFNLVNCYIQTEFCGIKAETVGEFVEALSHIPSESVFYHIFRNIFIGDQDLNEGTWNDFSTWAQDEFGILKFVDELNFLGLSQHQDIDILREELISMVNENLEFYQIMKSHKFRKVFYFCKPRLLTFGGKNSTLEIEDLIQDLSKASDTTIFYHLFVIPWFQSNNSEKNESLVDWITGHSKYTGLFDQIRRINPFLISIPQYKSQIIQLLETWRSEI